MNAREKAEELFQVIMMRKKFLVRLPLNCSQGEMGALLYFTLVKDGITASKLSEILNVSLPRVASMLNSLEVKQFIRKETNSGDKRKINIYVTEMGRKLILNKKKEAIDKITKIIERLDEEEINQYIKLTKKIGGIIEEVQE